MKFINKNCKIKIETEIKTRENQNQQQQWIHQPVLNANHSKTHTNTHSIHKYTHFFVASENEQHTCRSTTDNRPPTHFLCPYPQSDSGNENNIRLLEHWPSNTVDCRLWHRRRDKAESGHDYGERYLFLNEIRFFLSHFLSDLCFGFNFI